MYNGFFTTTQAGTITTVQRVIRVFIQQHGFQSAYFFIHIIDTTETFVRSRQIQPELPVITHTLNRCVILIFYQQGIIFTDIDTFHTAFTGKWIDRNGK